MVGTLGNEVREVLGPGSHGKPIAVGVRFLCFVLFFFGCIGSLLLCASFL